MSILSGPILDVLTQFLLRLPQANQMPASMGVLPKEELSGNQVRTSRLGSMGLFPPKCCLSKFSLGYDNSRVLFFLACAISAVIMISVQIWPSVHLQPHCIHWSCPSKCKIRLQPYNLNWVKKSINVVEARLESSSFSRISFGSAML